MIAQSQLLTPDEIRQWQALLYEAGMLETLGMAEVPHPPTPGLMSYLHDPVRQESAQAIRQENADRAAGNVAVEVAS